MRMRIPARAEAAARARSWRGPAARARACMRMRTPARAEGPLPARARGGPAATAIYLFLLYLFMAETPRPAPERPRHATGRDRGALCPWTSAATSRHVAPPRPATPGLAAHSTASAYEACGAQAASAVSRATDRASEVAYAIGDAGRGNRKIFLRGRKNPQNFRLRRRRRRLRRKINI